MANYQWKPLYEYETSCFTQIGVFLGWILVVGSFGFGVLLFTTPAFILGFVCIGLGIYILYNIYNNSTSTVRKALRKYGVESYCETHGLLLARTSSQRIGLFTTTGDLIINPEYRNIVFLYHYYLLENQSGLWGAYNASLSKQVINCEYTSIKVEENLNIIVVKDGMRYTFSPYGSLIHKVNAAMDDVVNKIMGKV